MRCRNCRKRWAPFPEEDFEVIEGEGFKIKQPDAEQKRREVFLNDQFEICPLCDEENSLTTTEKFAVRENPLPHTMIAVS